MDHLTELFFAWCLEKAVSHDGAWHDMTWGGAEYHCFYYTLYIRPTWEGGQEFTFLKVL
jgi:hypothetical protein